MLRVRSVDLPVQGWGASMSPKPTSRSMTRRTQGRTAQRPDPPVLVSILCEWSTRTGSHSQSGCCSAPETTPARADRTRPEHGTRHSNRSASNHYASTTADMPSQPPATRRHAPSTSEPPTTKNTPPTNESTPTSKPQNRFTRTTGCRPLSDLRTVGLRT